MKTIDRHDVKLDILERIARLQPNSMRRWGIMTAHQMICHLNDSLLCVMGEKSVSIDHSFKSRKLMKWCALYLPVQWPHGIATRPEIDQQSGGSKPADFEADRKKLVALTRRFSQQPRDFNFHPHPIFLEMTDKEWMRWGYLHADHHLRQFGL